MRFGGGGGETSNNPNSLIKCSEEKRRIIAHFCTSCFWQRLEWKSENTVRQSVLMVFLAENRKEGKSHMSERACLSVTSRPKKFHWAIELDSTPVSFTFIWSAW